MAVLDKTGRIVIPAQMREEMGVSPGDELILLLEDSSLRILGRSAAIEEARAIFRRHVPPDRSLSDELIAERRREAASE